MSHKIKAKKYWFILTDVDGWDLTTDKVRAFKIHRILDKGVETTDILYKMYIHKLGDISSMSTLWIDLSKKMMWVNDDLWVDAVDSPGCWPGMSRRRITDADMEFTTPFKFRCESLEEAEEIIDEMLEQNSLVVAPLLKNLRT